MKKNTVSISRIQLERISGGSVVKVEVGGRWIDVLRQQRESQSPQIVDAAGILQIQADDTP